MLHFVACSVTLYTVHRIADEGTSDIYNGLDTKAARRTLPSHLHRTATRKIDMILNAAVLSDLRYPPGNNLHDLGDDRKGQWAIRINDQYRICFEWSDSQGASEIQITDYH